MFCSTQSNEIQTSAELGDTTTRLSPHFVPTSDPSKRSLTHVHSFFLVKYLADYVDKCKEKNAKFWRVIHLTESFIWIFPLNMVLIPLLTQWLLWYIIDFCSLINTKIILRDLLLIQDIYMNFKTILCVTYRNVSIVKVGTKSSEGGNKENIPRQDYKRERTTTRVGMRNAERVTLLTINSN